MDSYQRLEERYKGGDLGALDEAALRVKEEAARAGFTVGPVWRGEQSGNRPDVYERQRRREYGIFAAESKIGALGYDAEGEPRAFFVSGNMIDLTGGEWHDDHDATLFVREWVNDRCCVSE